MKVDWVNGFEIKVRLDPDAVVLSANKEGLLSLAGIFTALANEPAGGHIHLDEHNALEDGSIELTVEKWTES